MIEWDSYTSSSNDNIISVKCSKQEQFALAELVSLGACPFSGTPLDLCAKENRSCKECILNSFRWNIIPSVDTNGKDITDALYACLPDCTPKARESSPRLLYNPEGDTPLSFCPSVPGDKKTPVGDTRTRHGKNRRNTDPRKISDIRQQDILRRPVKPTDQPVKKSHSYHSGKYHTERNTHYEKQSK